MAIALVMKIRMRIAMAIKMATEMLMAMAMAMAMVMVMSMVMEVKGSLQTLTTRSLNYQRKLTHAELLAAFLYHRKTSPSLLYCNLYLVTHSL